ncbi:MAG: hypothetical protein O2954_19275 [bacterium]|nr:hypothetical protein [bacterium]
MRRDPEYAKDHRRWAEAEKAACEEPLSCRDEKDTGDRRLITGQPPPGGWSEAHLRSVHILVELREKYNLPLLASAIYPPWPEPLPKGAPKVILKGVTESNDLFSFTHYSGMQKPYEMFLCVDVRQDKTELLSAIDRMITKKKCALEQKGFKREGRRRLQAWENYLQAWNMRRGDKTIGQIAQKLNKPRSTVRGWFQKAQKIIDSKDYVGFVEGLSCAK